MAGATGPIVGVDIDPKRAALVIVDLQNDFCSSDGYLSSVKGYEVGYAGGVAARIADALEPARAMQMTIVWLRSVYDFKYLNAAEIAKRGSEGCCLEGTWGAQFYAVGPSPGDIVIDKHHFSGFYETSLDESLRVYGIETLLIAGVATNVCVDSTLRDGFFRGYGIVLLEDCVGSANHPGHAGTLATVRANIGLVAQSRDVFALPVDPLLGPGVAVQS